MSNFVDNIDYVSTGLLNTTNDPVIGGLVSSGTGLSPRAGQLGKKVQMTQDEAYGRYAGKVVNGVTLPQLYSGIYQYVQFYLSSTASNAQGQVVFWRPANATPSLDGLISYIVTPDAPTVPSPIAGITLNAVTKGNYGWIQIAGEATVLFKTGITKATPVVGDLVLLDLTPSNTADVLADATDITSVQQRALIGRAVDAPVSASLSRVLLQMGNINC
jgi:hypothetical protein